MDQSLCDVANAVEERGLDMSHSCRVFIRSLFVVFQSYGMHALAALVQTPEVDPVLIKTVVEFLDFSTCNPGTRFIFEGASGSKHTVSASDVRRRLLARALSRAVRASPTSSIAVERYNYYTLKTYFQSFVQFENAARHLREHLLVEPKTEPEPSMDAMDDVLKFLQQRVEALAILCEFLEMCFKSSLQLLN